METGPARTRWAPTTVCATPDFRTRTTATASVRASATMGVEAGNLHVALCIGVCCSDVDECAVQRGLCRNGQCLNVVGTFLCVCNDGYELTADGRLCAGKEALRYFLLSSKADRHL